MTPSWDENMGYQIEQDTEELSKDPAYDSWLASELAWWKYIDSDPNWIKDHA